MTAQLIYQSWRLVCNINRLYVADLTNQRLFNLHERAYIRYMRRESKK